MYKNNEITNDDTAHKNDALKKDVFFRFFSFAACALYNDCTSNLWELKLDILIKAIFPYICFSTEFLLHILHDMSRERERDRDGKKKKKERWILRPKPNKKMREVQRQKENKTRRKVHLFIIIFTVGVQPNTYTHVGHSKAAAAAAAPLKFAKPEAELNGRIVQKIEAKGSTDKKYMWKWQWTTEYEEEKTHTHTHIENLKNRKEWRERKQTKHFVSWLWSYARTHFL